jgi:hypothetical protein
MSGASDINLTLPRMSTSACTALQVHMRRHDKDRSFKCETAHLLPPTVLPLRRAVCMRDDWVGASGKLAGCISQVEHDSEHAWTCQLLKLTNVSYLHVHVHIQFRSTQHTHATR